MHQAAHRAPSEPEPRQQWHRRSQRLVTRPWSRPAARELGRLVERSRTNRLARGRRGDATCRSSCLSLARRDHPLKGGRANETAACCGRTPTPPAYVSYGDSRDLAFSRIGAMYLGALACDECFCPPIVHAAASSDRAAAGRGLAILLLGHRERLVFDSIPPNVIQPTVADGTPVTLFAILESGRLSRAWVPTKHAFVANPRFNALDDTAMSERLATLVRAAGGTVGTIEVGTPRPDVRAPRDEWARVRMHTYPAETRDAVAASLRKEQLGYEAILRAEEATGARYKWVLLLRDDSHWFAPLNLSRFEEGLVHGKDCKQWGGWSTRAHG